MPELTVVSFNVHWGVGSNRAGYPAFDLVEVCRGFDADVIALQETWAPDGGISQHDEVAQALGVSVAAVPLARAELNPEPKLLSPAKEGRPEGEGDWCLALLTRQPIRTTRIVDLPPLRLDSWSRVLLQAELDIDGTNLTVVTTHFSHLEFGSPLHTRALRRGLPPTDRPGVFLGDLNMWGWTISLMAPKGWRRAVRGKTWPAQRPGHQIDHILVTPTVEVVRSQVLDHLGSDHRPVRARLRVR